MPLISVIIPVYKVEKYLDKCVESVVNQTYKNLEIILVDDGSPDNCPAICDKWGEKDVRIKVIHKPNGGLSDARNVGIDNCIGEYITFIDSDDYITENYVQKLVDAIMQNNADIAMCNFCKVDENDNIINENLANKLKDCVTTGENILYRYFDYNGTAMSLVISCCKLYKRNLFENLRFEIGRLNEDEFMFFPLFMKVNKAVMLKDKLYYYLQRDGSVMHSEINEEKIMSVYIFHNERLKFVENNKTLYKKVAVSYCIWIFLTALVNLEKSSELAEQLIKSYRGYILKYVFHKDIDLPLSHRIIYFVSSINPWTCAQLKRKFINN